MSQVWPDGQQPAPSAQQTPSVKGQQPNAPRSPRLQHVFPLPQHDESGHRLRETLPEPPHCDSRRICSVFEVPYSDTLMQVPSSPHVLPGGQHPSLQHVAPRMPQHENPSSELQHVPLDAQHDWSGHVVFLTPHTPIARSEPGAAALPLGLSRGFDLKAIFSAVRPSLPGGSQRF